MKLEIDEIIRSNRRTVSLEITRDGRLVVHAPLKMPKKYIEEAVEQKRVWVTQKQKNAEIRNNKHSPKSCAEGEMFEFLGKELSLSIESDAARITADGGKLHVPAFYDAAFFEPERFSRISQKADMKRAIIEWYRGQAGEVLRQRVNYHAMRAEVHYSSLKITGALSRWGSCSSDGRLCFTWRLVMAPVEMIDYVVVHELSHIGHPDHSKAFWQRVGSLMPDYAAHREWFRQNSALLRPDFFCEPEQGE